MAENKDLERAGSQQAFTLEVDGAHVDSVRDEGGEESGDFSIAKKAILLFQKAGLEPKLVPQGLHDGHDYPITYINTQGPFAPTNRVGEVRSSDKVVAAYNIIETNKATKGLPGESNQGLVVPETGVSLNEERGKILNFGVITKASESEDLSDGQFHTLPTPGINLKKAA